MFVAEAQPAAEAAKAAVEELHGGPCCNPLCYGSGIVNFLTRQTLGSFLITLSRHPVFFFSKHQDVFFHQRLEKQITNQEAMEEEDRLAEVGVGKQRKTAAGKFQGPPRGTASHPYLEDHPS